ncbi:MAG: hypothetical protein J0M01_02275 [Dechloromonas sp.]|jgi:hypothetical protein|nr:hypothetical protein [Dechloromonas sp.]
MSEWGVEGLIDQAIDGQRKGAARDRFRAIDPAELAAMKFAGWLAAASALTGVILGAYLTSRLAPAASA